MDTPSIFFIIIFAIPMFIFLFWIIRKDEQYKKWGYLVLVVLIVAALYTAFALAPSYKDLFPNR